MCAAPDRRAGTRASTSSTSCSAAASCPDRWCSSAASRASASRRCCCRSRRGCTSAAASRRSTSSGEESPLQVKLRADRLGESAGDVELLGETKLETILATRRRDAPARDDRRLDSDDLHERARRRARQRRPGARVRRAADALREGNAARRCSSSGTSRRAAASPDRRRSSTSSTRCSTSKAKGLLDHRVLRATKNRFGGVDEIGVFRMTAGGLIAGRESVGALPRRSPHRRVGQRGDGAHGGHAAAARRSAGARREGRLRHAAARRHRLRWASSRAPARGARQARGTFRSRSSMCS